MKLVGMMRVKNEARWIEQVIVSALEVCAEVHVMDDHSTDGTLELCRAFRNDRIRLYQSPFDNLDEARDKNWLLEQIRSNIYGDANVWVLAIDGDELLTDHHILSYAGHKAMADCYSLQVVYLWDREDQVRVDGVYGRFWRPSLFRLRPHDSFRATANGGNFHCGNVPQGFANSVRCCGARLLHFGYMHASDRRRKFDWYNQNDPHNYVEDEYRHMIQGDPGGPDASATLRHAGPLLLRPLVSGSRIATSCDGISSKTASTLIS